MAAWVILIVTSVLELGFGSGISWGWRVERSWVSVRFCVTGWMMVQSLR
jgi:hypothetical protein